MHTASRVVGQGLRACALVLLLAVPAPAVDLEKGKNLYLSRCMFCHGETGRGDGPAAQALKPPPTSFSTVEYWKTATAEGMKGIIASGIPGSAMLSFKSTLSLEQIDDVVAYIQSFKPVP